VASSGRSCTSDSSAAFRAGLPRDNQGETARQSG
jgi:hypothetical protein